MYICLVLATFGIKFNYFMKLFTEKWRNLEIYRYLRRQVVTVSNKKN